MSLRIDTDTIKRLRDALLREGAQRTAAGGDAAAPHRQAVLARVAPFAETMYLVMVADGHTAPEELASLRGALRMLTRDLLEDPALDELLQRCAAAAREQGAENMLQMLGSRLCGNRSDRETAFTLAAAVALADDTVTDAERQLVGDVAEWFGVSNRRAGELLGQVRTGDG